MVTLPDGAGVSCRLAMLIRCCCTRPGSSSLIGRLRCSWRWGWLLDPVGQVAVYLPHDRGVEVDRGGETPAVRAGRDAGGRLVVAVLVREQLADDAVAVLDVPDGRSRDGGALVVLPGAAPGTELHQVAAAVQPLNAGDGAVGAAVSLRCRPREPPPDGARLGLPDDDPLAVGDGEVLAVLVPGEGGGGVPRAGQPAAPAAGGRVAQQDARLKDAGDQPAARLPGDRAGEVVEQQALSA